MIENISEHITYLEATKTNTGLLNKPDDGQLIAMQNTAKRLFEPLREWYKKPIIVNSFFRSETVNRIVGGSKTSQHCKGEAIDLTAYDKTENRNLFFHVLRELDYDQLIWEKGNTDYPNWIHVSFRLNGKNRKQVIYNL